MAFVFAVVPSFVLAVIFGRRAQPMPIPAKSTCQIVFASLVMAASIMLVSRLHGLQGLIVQILVGVGVYATTLIAVNILGIRSHLAPFIRELGKSMRATAQR